MRKNEIFEQPWATIIANFVIRSDITLSQMVRFILFPKSLEYALYGEAVVNLLFVN